MKKTLIVLFLMVSISCFSGGHSWDKYKKETLRYQKEIPGWCSIEKAQKMMDLIRQTRAKVCVEIGVFGGSSIYPTAKALSFLKGGKVFAIDPWQKEECTKGYMEGNANYEWWSEVDLDKVYRNFVNMLSQHKLTKYCKVLRMSSMEALSQFADESIDILHIDGNHTEEVSLADVLMYFPKVKKGGYIWFDDANWSTTNQATMFLFEHCRWDMTRSIGTSCLLFQK
jgi:predicted O-methyltransferase YrrM